MVDYPMLTGLDTREDYNEDRWIGIGMLRNTHDSNESPICMKIDFHTKHP